MLILLLFELLSHFLEVLNLLLIKTLGLVKVFLKFFELKTSCLNVFFFILQFFLKVYFQLKQSLNFLIKYSYFSLRTFGLRFTLTILKLELL